MQRRAVAILKASNLTKIYGQGESQITVLKNINVEIGDGEFAVILGASGSGKSTLLNVLSGLELPNEGRVEYDGVDVCALSDKLLTEFRKNNVGFVFQQYYLLPNMNVDKNVKMGADLVGNKDYRKVIEAVGLGEKLRKMPSELSGGEQQRVAIARALAKEPKILFLDEPTGALDENTGRQILDYVARMHEGGLTMVMVTHNQNIAEMADKIFVMNSGNIVKIYKNEKPKSAYEIGW